MPQNVTRFQKEYGNIPPVKHLPFLHRHNSYVVSIRIVTLHIIYQFIWVESSCPKMSLWQLYKPGISYAIYCPKWDAKSRSKVHHILFIGILRTWIIETEFRSDKHDSPISLFSYIKLVHKHCFPRCQLHWVI